MLCDVDRQRSAYCSCFCRFPLPRICVDHLEKHEVGDQFEHFHLPIEAAQDISSQGEWETWKPKLQRLHAAYTQLKAQDNAITRAEEQVERVRLEILRDLEEEVKRVLGTLEGLRTALRAELESALRETSKNALRLWTPETDSLASLLWNYQSGGLEAVELQVRKGSLTDVLQVSVRPRVAVLQRFTLAPEQNPGSALSELSEARRQLRQMDDRLLRSASENLPDYAIQSARLARIYTNRVNEVSLFDFRTQSWGRPLPVSERFKFDDCSSYVLLDAETLFCCGSKRHADGDSTIRDDLGREAYLLRLQVDRARVITLPPMAHRRWNSGLLAFEQAIFVFGSGERYADESSAQSGQGKSVEKFSAGAWSLLPQAMNYQRSKFSPCELTGKAYLFASSTSAQVDVLDLGTCSFDTPISVQLPPDSGGCVCAVMGGDLVIICQTYTAKLGSYPQVVRSHTGEPFTPVSNAVVVGSWVYWVNDDGRAMRGGESGCFSVASALQ